VLPDINKEFYNLKDVSLEDAKEQVKSKNAIVYVHSDNLEELDEEKKALATKYNVRILSTDEEPKTILIRYLKTFLELGTYLFQDMFELKVYTGEDTDVVNLLDPEKWDKDLCVKCSMKVRKTKLQQEITEGSISDIQTTMIKLHEDFHKLYYTEKRDDLLLKKTNSVYFATDMVKMCTMNADDLSKLFTTIMIAPFRTS
jgi:hypothetical protein